MTEADAKERSRLTKEEWREYPKTVWHIAHIAHSVHPAVFPTEIPHRLIKLFTLWGDTVLDPFAGVGTTARAGIPIGRTVVCVEQNAAYVDLIRSECGDVRHGKAPPARLQVVHGDSRKLDFVIDNSVGLIVTSPPYWNKADYGKNAADLGNVSNHRQFFREIKPVFEECYRVLRAGRKLCLVTAHVNQHTNHGLLTFPLATDFIVLLRDLGFVLVNELIWNKDGTGGKWGSYGEQRPIFGSYPYPPNFHFKNVHEYILIFAKPSGKPTKGPKVLDYGQLMALAAADAPIHSRNCASSTNGWIGLERPKRALKKRRQKLAAIRLSPAGPYRPGDRLLLRGADRSDGRIDRWPRHIRLRFPRRGEWTSSGRGRHYIPGPRAFRPHCWPRRGDLTGSDIASGRM